MAEPGALDYFYGTEAEQYTFYRIPKVLFTDPGFRRITADAKILYGLMLDRMGLSIRNGWLDEQERVFIYFTLEETMDAMCCGHNKAVSLFTELDKVGLIERKKQGQGRPTKIYVKNFIRKEEVKTSENRKSALPETGTLDFRKSDTINTDKNKTDRNDTDPSIHPAAQPSEDRPPTAADAMDTIRAYREILKENIEYDILRKNLGYDCDLLDEILDILVDTVCSTRKMIRIGGEDYFKVSPQEKEIIDEKMAQLGIHNQRAYLRKMAVDGYAVQVDMSDFKALVSLLRNCSNNLNQIAKRVNSTGNLYQEDIADLQERYRELWGAVSTLLGKLTDL